MPGERGKTSPITPSATWHIKALTLGAVGIYTATQKIRTGLQQLKAGSRNFTPPVTGLSNAQEVQSRTHT